MKTNEELQQLHDDVLNQLGLIIAAQKADEEAHKFRSLDQDHETADALLCNIIKQTLGWDDIIYAYNAIDKWFA